MRNLRGKEGLDWSMARFLQACALPPSGGTGDTQHALRDPRRVPRGTAEVQGAHGAESAFVPSRSSVGEGSGKRRASRASSQYTGEGAQDGTGLAYPGLRVPPVPRGKRGWLTRSGDRHPRCVTRHDAGGGGPERGHTSGRTPGRALPVPLARCNHVRGFVSITQVTCHCCVRSRCGAWHGPCTIRADSPPPRVVFHVKLARRLPACLVCPPCPPPPVRFVLWYLTRARPCGSLRATERGRGQTTWGVA